MRPPVAPTNQIQTSNHPPIPLSNPVSKQESSVSPPPLDYPRIRAKFRDVNLSDAASCREAAKIMQGIRMVRRFICG